MPTIQSRDGTKTLTIPLEQWQAMQQMGFHKGWMVLDASDKPPEAAPREVPKEVLEMQRLRHDGPPDKERVDEPIAQAEQPGMMKGRGRINLKKGLETAANTFLSGAALDAARAGDMEPGIPQTEPELRAALREMGVKAPANYKVPGLTKLFIKHING